MFSVGDTVVAPAAAAVGASQPDAQATAARASSSTSSVREVPIQSVAGAAMASSADTAAAFSSRAATASPSGGAEALPLRSVAALLPGDAAASPSVAAATVAASPSCLQVASLYTAGAASSIAAAEPAGPGAAPSICAAQTAPMSTLLSALPHPPQLRPLLAPDLLHSIVRAQREKQQKRRTAAETTAKRMKESLSVWTEVDMDLDDDGTRCDICGNYDAAAEDQILLCDGCDVAVHQNCYSVKEIPAGEWFCRYCAAERSAKAYLERCRTVAARAAARAADIADIEATLRAEVEDIEREKKTLCILPKCCPLCPRSFGAYIPSSEGSQVWVHVNCAVWVPETWLVGMDDAGGLLNIPSWRFEKVCSICAVDEGAVVKCAAAHCTAVFHPICAMMIGAGMNLAGQAQQRRRSGVQFLPYCLRHRKEAYKYASFPEQPLEYNLQHVDVGHPFLRAVHLARRNRDILFVWRKIPWVNLRRSVPQRIFDLGTSHECLSYSGVERKPCSLADSLELPCRRYKQNFAYSLQSVSVAPSTALRAEKNLKR